LWGFHVKQPLASAASLSYVWCVPCVNNIKQQCKDMDREAVVSTLLLVAAWYQRLIVIYLFTKAHCDFPVHFHIHLYWHDSSQAVYTCLHHAIATWTNGWQALQPVHKSGSEASCHLSHTSVLFVMPDDKCCTKYF
jgi:hypothetical protein